MKPSILTNATYLNQYNMLIIGFCDGAGYGSNYGGNNPTNFSENGAQRILEFANTGKSVILAHDNTSSSVYDRTAQNGGVSGDSTWKRLGILFLTRHFAELQVWIGMASLPRSQLLIY